MKPVTPAKVTEGEKKGLITGKDTSLAGKVEMWSRINIWKEIREGEQGGNIRMTQYGTEILSEGSTPKKGF